MRAGGDNSPQQAEVLEALCRDYWRPLFQFVRRLGRAEHEAQDLTQAFFAHLLRQNNLAQAEPHRGRFRTFLLTALKPFVHDEWDKDGIGLTSSRHFFPPLFAGFLALWPAYRKGDRSRD